MQHSFDAMKTALRVLTAITEKHQPNQNDVEVLYGIAGPQPEGIGLDELACDVIHKAKGASPEAEYQVSIEDHEEIARIAYVLWQARGCPIGSPEEDWYRAEDELRKPTAAVAAA